MTKIDIFSGFLGAGKTTLIKKLIKEAFQGEKLVLIENEFGEIGIDGGFLKEAGINITEMNSGCICCSLVGDFGNALKKVIDKYHPDRVMIEPSGVGKLSDVINAVKNLEMDEIVVNSLTTVADAAKCKMYMKNFGEFYNNQVEYASSIILSRTKDMDENKITSVFELLREKNGTATIITTPWDEINGKKILDAMEHKNALKSELELLENDEDTCPECGHYHDHEHCHENHHDHEHCHEHHHHHADEVFTSFGYETVNKYDESEIKSILSELENSEKYGYILRAKGIVASNNGKWLHYDFVPGEINVRNGFAEVTGRICVIGSKINEDSLKELFRI